MTLAALAQRLDALDRRLQALEDNCAGCPGSFEPQDFELDIFPLNQQHQVDDFDDFQGAPR